MLFGVDFLADLAGLAAVFLGWQCSPWVLGFECAIM